MLQASPLEWPAATTTVEPALDAAPVGVPDAPRGALGGGGLAR